MQSPVKFLLILSILTLSVHSDEWNDEENYSADVKRSGFIYRYQHNNRRCVNPGVPGNGYSYFQSTNVGAIVIHKCKPGFALVGSKIRVCLSNGRWNLNIPNCVAFGSTSGCERPGSLENGVVLITSTHVNSIVKYKCRDGFKLVGSSYQVCRANGRWTGTFPKCIASGCPKLSNPPNGQVKVTSNRIGAVATYSCNSGFNLAGNINRVCRPDGSWSGSVPTCQAPSCGTLANPQNGVVTFSSTTIGSTAVYSCNEGFVLVGVKTRTCQSSREWSGRMPVCRPLSCGRLKAPENGKIIIAGTTAGSIATYSCNPGFKLHGARTRACQNNGKWSGTAPTCKQIKCETLSPPDNGFIVFSSSSPETQKPGDKATYSCSKGFRLVKGTSVRVCQQDGSYSGTQPLCQSVSCGKLRDPPNGVVILTGTIVGDRATYSCNRGFILNGNKVRTCQFSGVWSEQEPICKPVTCGALSNPNGGQVKVFTLRLGGIAKYSCNDGHQLVGSHVLRCLASGEWSDDPPVCRITGCVKLSNPLNGIVRLSGTSIGTTATYYCNKGYKLYGHGRRTCLKNSHWSGQEPICKVLKCERPRDPENGEVSVSGTSLGDVASYTCHEGFNLVGVSTRTCRQDGLFSDTTPTCQPISCGQLSNPANGRVEVIGETVDAIATYTCNDGFILNGDKTRICQRDGSFTGEAPTCQIIICEILANINNGQVTTSGNRPGAVATYSCNSGFDLVGQNTRTCQADGTYSGQAPTCTEIDCGRLNNIPNGRVEFSSTNFGSTASYFCNEGYELSGNKQRTCQQNGQWSGTVPTCRVIDCGFLSSPPNGNVDFTSTTFLSKASYSCNSGFKLSGVMTRTCQSNGQWSSNVPSCQPIDCEQLDDIDNGFLVVNGDTVGAVATYTCNVGFKLIGNKQRTCQSDGQYTGTAPFCQLSNCHPLDDPQNGIVKFGGLTVGSQASYACNKGFILVGTSTRTCQPDGYWSAQEPLCESIKCSILNAPAYGDVRFPSTEVGAIATYSCQIGFTLIGAIERACQIDGRWTGSVPVCKLIECGPLESPANGIVSVSGSGVGATATYGCSPNFKLVGTEIRTCNDDGGWSDEAPICQSIDCGALLNPEYGKVTFTETVTGSLATYSCTKGFTLKGVTSRVCLLSGEWSKTAPTCEPEDCGDLNDPVNGKVEMSGTAFWDTATYTCNNGFEIVGNAIRTCEETGKWSGVAPFCRSVSCGFLNSPDNGRVTFTGVVLNSVATYDCFQGYEIVGQTERICQYDGQWSGREPHCQAVSCGPLTDPENGKVMLKGTEVFEIATYTCNEGFGLIGVSSRICQASGSWSDDVPTCEPSDCGQLSSPLNGMVKTTGTKYWDTAAYSCMPGYHLNGKDTRTCLETGSWSDEEPYCEAVDCRDLVPLEYGEVSFTSTKFRARASYSCNDGFQLIGDGTRMCEADGSWSGHAPFCQSVFCFEIFPPENGELHLSKGNSPGSIATYSCNVGYQLLGNEERHCKNDGHWSGSDPFCQSAGCGSLADILNGQISLSNGASFGSIATYTCDSGYELVGKSTRECSTGGRWSGTRPICKSVNCGQLLFPGFGQVALTGTTPGDTATYSCNSGYQLVGDAVRTCQNNRQWTGSEPTCDALDCGTLEDPTNGAVNIRDTAAGSVALYECNPGYILAGKPQRVCLPYSQWSGSAPTCNAVDCGPLSPPPNGDIRVSVTTFGSFARYSCSIGYELTGLEVRVCQTDGTWSGSAPICKISECPALAKPANGRVTLTGRTFGSKATYSCNRGYELIGGSMRECTSNHVWSGKEPICKPVSCGSLTHPDNGRVEYSDSIVGSVAVYYCDNSYAINGLRTRACQSNGQWTGQTPTCDPIKAISTCDDLPDPPNGHVIISGSNSGDTATYTCFVGYNVVGVDIRYCRDDGTWTGTEPRCRPVDCGQLDVPRYGEIRYINSGFGAIARYTCLPGYELVGDYSRTCKSDGYWSGESPHCIPDSSATPPPPPLGCGDPGTPANGVKIGISYSIGSVVYYECNEGFRLDGPRSRLCRFDGRWSEQLPSCIGNGQCVGNTKVVDQCGQQCTCENGRLINCCRLRQDFTSLTSAEKKRYINAVVTVIEEPQYRGTYTKLLNEYKKSFGTLAQDTSPDTSQFFVWNRYFLIEFENLLREVDCSITIPYYDWTNLHANPYIHPIWADEEGFGKSYRQSDNCVSSGPFRYDEYSLISSAGGGCLKREYSNKKFPSRAFIERDVLTRPASEFSIFQRSLQLFVHTNVRCFIGGTMCTKDAANDPIFILHLAQIDFIYNRWQSFDEERLKVRYANDNTDLALAEGLLVSQFHDNSNLPNGVAVCYKKPSYKSHVPASLQFLAQSFSGSTNNDRIYVTCVSEDKFSQSGLTITAEDKEIINEKCKH